MKIGFALVASIVISTACVYSVRYIEIPALQVKNSEVDIRNAKDSQNTTEEKQEAILNQTEVKPVTTTTVEQVVKEKPVEKDSVSVTEIRTQSVTKKTEQKEESLPSIAQKDVVTGLSERELKLIEQFRAYEQSKPEVPVLDLSTREEVIESSKVIEEKELKPVLKEFPADNLEVKPKFETKSSKSKKITIKPASSTTKVDMSKIISSQEEAKLRSEVRKGLSSSPIAKEKAKAAVKDRDFEFNVTYVKDKQLLEIISKYASEMNAIILGQHDIIAFHNDLTCNNGSCYLYVSDAFIEHKDHNSLISRVLLQSYTAISKMPIEFWPIIKAADSQGRVIETMKFDIYKNSSKDARFIVDQRALDKESREFPVPERSLNFSVEGRMQDVLIGFDMHNRSKHLTKEESINLTEYMVKLINMQTLHTVGAKMLNEKIRYIDDINDEKDTVVLTFSRFISQNEETIKSMEPLLDFMKQAIEEGSKRGIEISLVPMKS